jgi:hypothetical protein
MPHEAWKLRRNEQEEAESQAWLTGCDQTGDRVEVGDLPCGSPVASIFICPSRRCLAKNLVIGPDLARFDSDSPGTNLGSFVPPGHPLERDLTARDEVVYWDFLDDVSIKPSRPWLIVQEQSSSIGPVKFVVPRLVPKAGWVDSRTYAAWEEAAWRGEVASIPPVVDAADVAAEFPRGRTRPRLSFVRHRSRPATA